MLLGGPRQLLILGIPTFTLVFGLLVLRHRRRKRGTLHTDPGGIEGKTPNQEPFTDENVHIKNIPASRNSVTTSSLPIVEEIIPANVVGVDSRNKVHPIVASNAEAEKLVLVPQEVPANGPKVALISAVTPEPIVIDLTADSPRKIIDLSTDDSSTDESCYTDREEGELTNSTISDLSSPVEELTSSKSEDSTETDEIADSGKIIEEQKGNELEEGELLDSSGEEGLLESQQLTNKTTVVKDVNSKEESSVKMKKAEQGELVDKLVTLELDAMNMSGGERKDESSERDSANHSPSEVMLASPSISNFSDAHSEGSSDSGKGHSDVALSPSRTPAGGSSLAGDLALSLYEFVLPQNTVGRLIGRHGTSLHEIRSATGANIYIKRHPETNKLKICAIEGTQQDIDKALEKIRQKFPLRRFPQLTLEKVSFVSLNTPPPIKLEDFNLQLIEGVNNDVILSSLISAAHFFLQQPSHPSYSALASLNVVMNTVYNSPEAPVLDPPTQNAVCAAPAMGGWYRAQIMSVDEEHHSSYVKFLDYGGYLLVESNTLRQIRGDFLTLPFQAVECYLANVAPAEGDLWTDEARQYVQALTQGQILQAQIYEHAEDGTPLVYLYSTVNNKVILVNEWLVSAGYAILTAPASLSDQEE